MSDPDPGKFEDFSDAMHEELSGEEIESEFEQLTEKFARNNRSARNFR